MAAGVTVVRSKLEDFREAFLNAARDRLQPEDYIQPIELDGMLSPETLDRELMDTFERLEPHGMGNPAPLFGVRDTQVASARVVGEHHLRLDAQLDGRRFEAIGFRMGKLKVRAGDRVDLAYTPQWNTYQGLERIQLRLKDIVVRD